MDALIRAAGLPDAPGIAEVHVRSWQAAYRGIVPDPILEGLDVEDRREMRKSALSEPRPRTRRWVAEVDGRVVGFAATGPAREEKGAGELYAIWPTTGDGGSGEPSWTRP